MKAVYKALIVFATIVATNLLVFGQTDEARQASGLPFKIEPGAAGSAMVISGKVTLEGAEQLSRKPVVSVSIFLNGVPVGRTQAQATGNYVIRDVPRQVVTMVIEVDGAEVSRQNIVAPGMGSVNLDINVPWALIKGDGKPGVISARDGYKRPEANIATFQKAQESLRNGKDGDAVKLLDTLLAADPKDYEAWTELGNIYFRKKSIDSAEAAYFKAIELKRDYFLALMNLGKLYFGAKRFDDAIIVLSNAAKADTDSADAHHFLGEAYLAVKKGSMAVPELNAAIKLAPVEKVELHLRLASLYDAANLKKRAADEYRMFLEKRPDHPDKAKLEKYIAENK